MTLDEEEERAGAGGVPVGESSIQLAAPSDGQRRLRADVSSEERRCRPGRCRSRTICETGPRHSSAARLDGSRTGARDSTGVMNRGVLVAALVLGVLRPGVNRAIDCCGIAPPVTPFSRTSLRFGSGRPIRPGRARKQPTWSVRQSARTRPRRSCFGALFCDVSRARAAMLRRGCLLALLLSAPTEIHAAAEGLDPMFGGGGIVTTAVGTRPKDSRSSSNPTGSLSWRAPQTEHSRSCATTRMEASTEALGPPGWH